MFFPEHLCNFKIFCNVCLLYLKNKYAHCNQFTVDVFSIILFDKVAYFFILKDSTLKLNNEYFCRRQEDKSPSRSSEWMLGGSELQRHTKKSEVGITIHVDDFT